MSWLFWFFYASFGAFLLHFAHKKASVVGKQAVPHKDYPAFRRYDWPWNQPLQYVCAVTLLPIRLVLVVFFIFAFNVGSTIMFSGFDKSGSKPLPRSRVETVKKLTQIAARGMLFVLGFLYIDEVEVTVDGKRPVKDSSAIKGTAPVIISNHVSWMDIIYYMHRDFPSFVSKASVSKIPLVGNGAIALQCLFVDRSSAEDRKKAMEAVSKRQEAITKGEDFPPMLIFPEGTTSNGTSILPFKRGPFMAGLPVQISALSYSAPVFNGAFDCIDLLPHLILVLSQPFQSLKVTRFPVYYPNEEEKKSWEKYAEGVRALMSRELKVPVSGLTYEDKLKYVSLLQGKDIKTS